MKAAEKHLLVDGYNMIHRIGSLSRIFAEGPEAACEALVRMARTIHDEEGIRVTVVFDGREKRLQVVEPVEPCGRPTFAVVYAPRQLTADGLIEQLLARAKNPDGVTVASRDNMIREAAAARGAFFIDGDAFEEWVGRCEGRTRSRLRSKAPGCWKRSLGDIWGGAGPGEDVK